MSTPRKPTDAERYAKLADENMRLRYLCFVLIPELRPAARLLPNDSRHDRLDYLIRCVDPRVAADFVFGSRV